MFRLWKAIWEKSKLRNIAEKGVWCARVHLSCSELNRVLLRVRASLCVGCVPALGCLLSTLYYYYGRSP